ncbi:Uncharacterised protein [Mycobacterium tuberculosis]|nr:Uncharacterised protein [Mycobacterium tuberculosis]
MLVERHHIDSALLDAHETARAIGRVLHGEALSLQSALDQAREIGVVVDI